MSTADHVRVFVDARMAQHTGIGRYICGNLQGLCGPGFRFVAGVPSADEGEVVRAACKTVALTEYRAAVYGIKERWLGYRGLVDVRDAVDVYWYPQYNVPWRLPPKSVVTIHDLTQFDFNFSDRFDFPYWRALLRSRVAWWILKRAVGQAAKVICVSASTRGELLRLLPDAARKSIVIGNGVSDNWSHHSAENAAEVRRITGGLPYLLAVGLKKPHKNHRLLLGVLEDLAAEGFPHRLVIIGKRESSWLEARDSWIATSHMSDRLVDLDGVSDDLLSAFYGCSQALLMPSLNEGFGLPPLEAMVAGVPVICSNRGGLPETVGNAALVIDPFDRAGWVDAIKRLLASPELRNWLIAAGRQRAQELSWTSTAAKLGAVLREVASR